MRASIGLIALVLLAVGLLGPLSASESITGMAGACLRVGIMMGIWWFAYPQTKNIPAWLTAACFVTLLLVMRWPKLLVVAIPLLAILWFLGPREKQAAKR
jgi:hypothetical protein